MDPVDLLRPLDLRVLEDPGHLLDLRVLEGLGHLRARRAIVTIVATRQGKTRAITMPIAYPRSPLP